MPLWMRIHIVKLHELFETMPLQMRAVIEAKGSPVKYFRVQLFLAGQCKLT